MRVITLGDGVGPWSMGVSIGAAALKIFASLRSAHICSFPRDENGDAGAGFMSALVSNRAASAALLADELRGISMSCGKDSTVRAIRSDLVLVTYIVWHW